MKNTIDAPYTAFCSMSIAITEPTIKPIERSLILSAIKSLIAHNYISFEVKNQYA